jgi:uncharacterized protein YdeI (BOF family)
MKKLLTLCMLVLTSTFILVGCTQNNNETTNSNEIFEIPENSNGYKMNSNVRWGFIDKTGKVVIKPQFQGAVSSSEGIAIIVNNQKDGYINSNGAIIVKPQFDMCYNFKDDMGLVCNNGKYGYVNSKGSVTEVSQLNSSKNFIFTGIVFYYI